MFAHSKECTAQKWGNVRFPGYGSSGIFARSRDFFWSDKSRNFSQIYLCLRTLRKSFATRNLAFIPLSLSLPQHFSPGRVGFNVIRSVIALKKESWIEKWEERNKNISLPPFSFRPSRYFYPFFPFIRPQFLSEILSQFSPTCPPCRRPILSLSAIASYC